MSVSDVQSIIDKLVRSCSISSTSPRTSWGNNVHLLECHFMTMSVSDVQSIIDKLVRSCSISSTSPTTGQYAPVCSTEVGVAQSVAEGVYNAVYIAQPITYNTIKNISVYVCICNMFVCRLQSNHTNIILIGYLQRCVKSDSVGYRAQ